MSGLISAVLSCIASPGLTEFRECVLITHSLRKLVLLDVGREEEESEGGRWRGGGRETNSQLQLLLVKKLAWLNHAAVMAVAPQAGIYSSLAVSQPGEKRGILTVGVGCLGF